MTEQFANMSIGFLEDIDFEQDKEKSEGEQGTLNMSSDNPEHLYMTMVFADWCGPCKSAKPYYKALSKLLNENNINTVHLTCINATGDDTQRPSEKKLNDNMMALIGVRGFPTFLFFEGGKKTKYEGKRTVSDFIKSIASRNKEVKDRLPKLLEKSEKLDKNMLK